MTFSKKTFYYSGLESLGYVESLGKINNNADLLILMENNLPKRYPYDLPMTLYWINEEFDIKSFVQELVYGTIRNIVPTRLGLTLSQVEKNCYLIFCKNSFDPKIAYLRFYEEGY